MSLQICVLASGSKGNCTYISDGTTRLLIDVGISCRRVEQELAKLGVQLQDINAILLTHEHIDHIYGLPAIQRKYHTPTYTHEKTAACVDIRMNTQLVAMQKANFDTGFRLGGITITPFRVLHDAVCPMGYTVQADGHKISYVTDLGVVTDSVRQNARGSELVVLESNHDLNMLAHGRYPAELQARIRSELGHLSNVQSAELALDLVQHGAGQLVLAHLSEENNTPDLAVKTASFVLQKKGVYNRVQIRVASQNCATDLIQL